MAKGNDGNYLQHCVEVEAGLRLAQESPDGRLHVAFGHGMAPFECFDKGLSSSCGGLVRRRIKRALDDARGPFQQDEPSIVTAYRNAGASERRYPNSAELLRAVIGADNLTGGIAETHAGKHAELVNAWKGFSVVPMLSSWRSQVTPGGALACPEALSTPWLFTLDPMTYQDQGCADDDKLYREDLDLLASSLMQFVHSGQMGIAALFSYAVRPEVQPRFDDFAAELTGRIGAANFSFSLTHQGGNRNMAALLCPSLKFLWSLDIDVVEDAAMTAAIREAEAERHAEYTTREAVFEILEGSE